MEPAHWVIFDPFQSIALEGESGVPFEDADFIVYIPLSVSIGQVSAEVEKYKLADKKYKIIQR